MLKKSILTFTLCAALAGAGNAFASSAFQQEEAEVVEVVEAVETRCEGCTKEQPLCDSDCHAAGAEAAVTEAGIPESEIARKMKQAEKAKNAAENDSWGGAITLIAMGIVLSALIILSILFLCFGKISSFFMTSRKKEAHGVTHETAEDHHHDQDTGEEIAAICMALAEHFGQNHDVEDTILTIKRMRKSYSPWNSKIYNMRQLPGLTHQTRK